MAVMKIYFEENENIITADGDFILELFEIIIMIKLLFDFKSEFLGNLC